MLAPPARPVGRGIFDGRRFDGHPAIA
jgi:hypothetical protein